MKAAFKVFIIGLWLVALIGPAVLAKLSNKRRARDFIKRLFCRGVLCILGVRVEPVGALAKQRPLMVVSNHVSYLDILVLAAYCDVCFTPKSEIGSWPIIKTLCWLTDSIYIDRKPEKVKQANDAILHGLRGGDAIVLFPEATTGNGTRVLPFKSALFGLAEQTVDDVSVAVQPVTIAYSSLYGLPIDLTQWPKIAWYGDSELVPHLWELLSMGSLRAKLIFQEPVWHERFGNRKQLAEYCHKSISAKLEEVKSRTC